MAANFIQTTSHDLHEAVNLSELLFRLGFVKFSPQSIIGFSDAAFFVRRLFVDLSGTNETNLVHHLRSPESTALSKPLFVSKVW